MATKKINADALILPGVGSFDAAIECLELGGWVEPLNKFAKIDCKPLLGICLGMQIAVIEFAQNICNLEGAYSSEFQENCQNPIIDLMVEQKYIEMMGGSMRLGAYPCKLTKKSLAQNIYQNEEISERHRERRRR